MLRGARLTKTVRITAKIVLILGVFSFVFGNFSQNIKQFKPKEAEASIGGAYATRLWSSGFELQSTTAGVEYTNNVTNTPSINTSIVRSGSASMRTNASAQVMGAEYDWATADNATRTTYRAYIRVASAPAAETGIMSFFDVGNTRQISIRMNTDRTLELWNEEDTAQIGGASAALATDTWYRVELQYDFGTAATGDSIAKARLDGVEFASSTTQNMANGAMTFQWGVLTSTTADFYWDDLAVNQDVAGATVNNWVGEGKIVHLKPNGNGINTAWTGDYTAVDEVTPNDATDFINCTTDTGAQNEDYTLENFTSITGTSQRSTIRLVQPGVRVATTTAASSMYSIGVLESGGSIDNSANVTVAVTAWNTNDDTSPKNPKLHVFNRPGSTSAKITANDVDGYNLRIGSGTDCNPDTQITTAWLLVEYATEGGRIYSSGIELQSLTSGMEWDTTAGTMAIDTTTKRSGLASLRIHSLVSTTEESMSETFSPVNENGPLYLRTYLRVATNPSADNRIIEFKNSSSTVIAYMVLSSTGTLKLFDEDGQVGSDSSAISTNTWYRIEMQIDARGAGATDTVEAKIDGTNFASSTTRDLSTGVDKFLLGGNLNGEAQTQGDWNFDDIALNNGSGTTQTGYPGAGSIVHMQPDADGDTVSWTNTFTNIDEVTPDDGTTLITTSTANAVEEANLESASTAGIDAQSVTLVSVGVRANRSTTAESSITVRLKDGASGPYIESSEIRLLNTSYFTNDSTASSNWYPLTAYNPPMLESTWTTGKLDTMQIGVREVLDTTGNSQVSALWALVEFIPTVYTVSGICKQYDKTTNCSDGLSVKASVNGSGPTTGTTSGGTFSVNLNAKPNTFESIHVYLDGVASTDRANAVTVYDGSGNITGVQLIFRTLSIGSDDGTTPGWGELDNWDNSTSGDADVFFDVDGSGVLTVDSGAAYTDERLLIVNGGTFQTNQTVNTHDIEIYGGLTIETGTSLNVNGSYYNDATTGIATFQGTSTLNMTSTSTGELFTTGGDSLVNLTFNGIGGGWTLQDNVTLSGTFTITNGNLNASSRTITLSGTGTPFINNGTFTYSTSTVLYTGNGATNIAAINMSNASGGTNGYYNLRVEPAGATAHTLGTAGSQTIGVAGNLTIGNGTNAGSTAATNNPTITVTGNMTIAAGATYTTGNSPLSITGNLVVSDTGSTGTMSGSGSGEISVIGDVIGGGTINISGNTFKQVVSVNEVFGSTANSNNWTFNNLSFENTGAADRTITTSSGGSGQIIVNGTLTVGNAGNSFNTVIDNNTNDRIFDLNGTTSINITSKGSFTMSDSASFTVADDFTNNGTFTATSGSTVTFDTTATTVITGSTTFHNFTSTAATKTINFTAGQTFTINGLLSLDNATLNSTTGSSSWTINHQGTESITNTTVTWSACHGSSTQITVTSGNNGGNNGTCWVFPVTRTISGVVYTNDESTVYGTVTAMKLSVNGGTAQSTNSTVTTGAFSFSVSGPNNGDIITIWLDTTLSGVQGTLVLKYGTSCTGTPDCTGLKVVRDQVRIQNFHTGNIANTDLAACDNDTGTGCTDTDIGFTANSGVLSTTWATNELGIVSGTTFAPGGNVNAQKVDIAGTYTGSTETLTISGAGTNATCTNSAAVPLCITGTFTPTSNTVTFSTGSATNIAQGTFNNLSFTGAATYTLATTTGHTFTVNGNFTVGTGAATIVNANTNDPTVDINGNFISGANSTFQASNSGSLTIAGDFTHDGTWTHNNGTITFDATDTGNSMTTSQFGCGNAPWNITFSGGGSSSWNIAGGNWCIFASLIIDGGTVTSSAGVGIYMASGDSQTVGGNGVLNLANDGLTLNCDPDVTNTGNWSVVNLNIDGGCGSTDFSGSGTITVTNVFNVSAGTANLGSKTIILTKTGTGQITNTGTLNFQTSTIRYTGAGATTIGNFAYHNLESTPAGTHTHSLAAGTFNITGNLVVGTGSHTSTLSADTNDPTLDVNGDVTINTSATFVASATNDLTVGGSWNNDGTFTHSSRTVTFDSNATGKTIDAGDTNGAFYNITFNNANGGWTFQTTNLRVTNVLTITTGSVNGGSVITTLTGSGTPFVRSVTWNPGTGTVYYTGSSATSVEDGDYYNLTFGGATTYTPQTGTFTINNDFSIDNSIGATIAADTNNPTITITRDFILNSGNTFTSTSGNLTVGRNFLNQGSTFTHNSGTVILNTTTTAEVRNATGSEMVFHNFTAATSTKIVQFYTTGSAQYRINGLLTLTGVTVTRVGGSGSWTINHQGTESVTNSTISWSACSTSPLVSTSITALTSSGNTNGGNNGACWIFSSGITVSGVVYTNDETTPDGTGYNLKLSVNGGTADTAVSNGSGVFSFSTSTGPTAGQFITLWIDSNGGNRGSTIIKYGTSCTGNPDCTGIKIVRDQIRLENFNTGNIANTDLANCDNDTGSGCADTDIGFTANAGVLTVSTNWELKIESSANFAPGGTVTSPKLDIAGTYTGGSETLTLTGSGTSSTCSNAAAVPLCVSGTFTPNSNTTAFTSTSATSITAGTFNNLSFTPAGTVTYTPLAGTFTVGGNLVVGNGSNTLTLANNTNNPVFTVTGNATIAASSIFTTGNGNTTISGDLTTTGTLSGSGSGTINVVGSVGGTGKINLTGGTFEQRVATSGKTFGGGSALDFTATEVTLLSGTGTQEATGIIYDKTTGKYVVAGFDSNAGKVVVWEGTDLASLTQRDVDTSGSPTSGNIYHDTANGKYLIVGGKSTDAVVWESTNLTSWTARTIATGTGSQFAYDIIYQNGYYIAAGSTDQNGTDGYIWTSTTLDGTWTANALATGGSFDNVYSVTYNPYDKLFVAVGEVQSGTSSGAAYVWESTDLSSWTARLVEDASNIQAGYQVRYDKTAGKYYVFGIHDATGGFQFDQVMWDATTPSGTWTRRNMGTDSGFESSHSNPTFDPLTGRYAIGGIWNVSGNDGPIIWETTTPTSTWNARNIDTDSAKQDIQGLIYDTHLARFVAAGYDRASGNDDAVLWYTTPTGWRFNNLIIGNGTGSNYTVTLNATTPIIVGGNLDVGKAGDTGTTTLDNETNDEGLMVSGNLVINATGVLQASSTTPLIVGGSWTNSGTFTAGTGTVIMNSITTGKTLSGTLTGSAGKFNNLTFDGLGGAWTVSNNMDVAASLTIAAGTFNAGSVTTTIAGSTPLTNSGTFNANTSTINFTTGSNITIENVTYYNLGILPGANSAVHYFPSGTFTVGNDLTLGNGTNTSVSINANTNDPTLDINGSIIISANTTFVASDTNNMTVAKSWTNSGTFTHSSRTVTFDGSVSSQTITANNSNGVFYNVTISGSGSWSVSTNAMQVTNALIVNTGTLQGTQNVTVNGGAVTGTGFITMTGGTFTVDGASGNFGGDNNWSFNNLSFTDIVPYGTVTATGTGSITISSVLSVSADKTLNLGSKNWIFTGSGTPISRSGTINASTSTVTFTSNSGVTALSSAAITSGNAFYNLVINATSGTPTFTAGVAVTVNAGLTVTAGVLSMGSNALIVGNTGNANSGDIKVASGQSLTQNSGATTTILTAAGSTPCIGSNGASCAGTTGTITFGGLTIGNSNDEVAVNINGTNTTITVQDVLTVTSHTLLNAGSSTISLTGNGTVFTRVGTFTASTSTVAFNSTSTTGTTIPALTYYNLTVNRTGNTFTSASGTYTVNNNLTITAGTLELNTNDPTLTISGNLIIGDSLSASNTNNLTVGGNFVNNGTFTHNNGTVVINPTGLTSQVNGSTSTINFYNFTMTPSSEKTIQFKNGGTIGFAGTVTISGAQGTPVNISSDSAGVRWNINLTGTAAINYVYLKDSGCHGTTNTVVLTQNVIDGSNNGACWILIIRNGGGATGGGGDSGTSGGGAGQSGGGQGGGGSFVDATGTAVLSSQVVVSVTITLAGSGYVSIPNVCFSGGGGSGATATATISNGSVSAVNITAGGNNYSSPPTVVFQGGNTPDAAPACSGGGQGGGGQGGGGGGGSP